MKKEIITEQDERILTEMMNRLYYIQQTYPKSYLKLIEDEINRKRKMEKNITVTLCNKIKKSFDKKTAKELIKILKK